MNAVNLPAARDRLPRAAAGVLISILGAVILTAEGISPRAALLRWGVYVVITGIIINSQVGFRSAWLALASFASAVSLLFCFLWLMAIGCAGSRGDLHSGIGSVLDISGKNVCQVDHVFAITLMTVILVATGIAIWIACYARPAIVGGLTSLGMSPEMATTVERLLNVAVAIVGLVWMLLQKIVGP